jgi:hypothetical protein
VRRRRLGAVRFSKRVDAVRGFINDERTYCRDMRHQLRVVLNESSPRLVEIAGSFDKSEPSRTALSELFEHVNRCRTII